MCVRRRSGCSATERAIVSCLIAPRVPGRARSASLEKDLLRRRCFPTRQEARTAVFDYIETFYNPIRLHSTLDYRSPVDYEKMKEQEQAA